MKKELKENDDVPDWHRVASSETELCFLAQYTDKTHKNTPQINSRIREGGEGAHSRSQVRIGDGAVTQHDISRPPTDARRLPSRPAPLDLPTVAIANSRVL